MPAGRPPSRRPRAAIALAVLTALLAGAALGVESPAATGGARGSALASRGAAQPVHLRAQPVRVSISDFAFHPRRLTIAAGRRVAFVNDDSTAHTATRRGSFDSGRIRPGRAVVVRFKRAGVYAYHCKIHDFMRGKIVVE